MPLKVPTGLPALEAVRAEGVKIEEFDTVTSDT